MRNRAGLATEAKILTATRRLLSERGLEGTTVKAICDAAGIRAGSFYNLFPSKEDAILSVVREAISAVDPHPEGDHETVEELVDAYVRFVEEEPVLARVYLTVAVLGGLTDPEMNIRILRHHQRRTERFAASIRNRRPELSAEEATERAEALLAALNGYALHRLLDPSFDFAGHARRLLRYQPA
ncbi:MAG: hypothetical protein KatS3mg011_0873 [Acidimicrobiia bacterium]|jgi:AcrR family transcriptional regulator|nr:MAG: hypothetical protein KatS3mg011_0873 [Acidimicrobiia bacterium]